MTNAHSAEQDHFDLLPFIGIMMCLLGTLLLVTMIMGAIHIGAGVAEGWVPQPDPNAKLPVLIEWDGKSAVWHSEAGIQKIDENFVVYANEDGTWIRIDPDDSLHEVDGPQPGPFDTLIKYLDSHRTTHYALIAVRPSGFENFARFTARFRLRKIEIGSEPIEQGKPVRLIPPGGKYK